MTMNPDLEAQLVLGNGESADGRPIRISQQRLEELVGNLARSVHILQSVMGSYNSDIQLQPRGLSSDKENQTITMGGAEELHDAVSLGHVQKKDVNDVKTIVAPPGEVAESVDDSEPIPLTTITDQMCLLTEKRLKKFDTLSEANPSLFKDSNVDSWAALRHLDWAFFGQLYTVAESRPNVTYEPDRTLLPAVVHDLIKDNERRLSVQKQIYLGLSGWWWCKSWPGADHSIQHHGVLDMGPLVSLIGMRLPYSWGRPEEDRSALSLRDGNRLCILIVLIFSQQQISLGSGVSGNFWGNALTVGQVLDQCYQQEILHAPGRQDLLGYKEHVCELIHAMKLMNMWQMVNYGNPDVSNKVEDIRAMSVSDLWENVYFDDDFLQPESEDDGFRCVDLSLEMLHKVGKLRFEWTEFLDEHLDLDTDMMVLKIFWFGFAVKACPMFHIGCQKYGYTYCHANISESPLVTALSNTYSLIFRSQKDTQKDNIVQYGKLPVPQWLRVFHGNSSGPLDTDKAKDMSFFLQPDRPWVSDIRHHLADVNVKLSPTHLFKKYQYWGTRLRQLKAHMDSQKPTGIRGLWADKRDSSQWFTFWAVVVIGSLSIVLTSLGLIVSIVQTVGTFKGLE